MQSQNVFVMGLFFYFVISLQKILNPIELIDFPCILLMQIYHLHNSRMWFSVILNDSPSVKPSLIVLLLSFVKISFESLHNLDENVHSRNKCVNVSYSLEQKEHILMDSPLI